MCPPRLRSQSSALDGNRIRFDDGFCERILPIDARKHPGSRAGTCRNASPWGFSTRWRNTGQRSVESEPRIPTRYSNSVMARQPARWRACPAKRILSTGRPSPSLAGRAGHVSSPLPGIGVNFLPQRRHRRFRTRRSSVSKNRPRLVPAISPPHAPDYRATARPARARRPPIGIAVRRHSWDTGTASRACCAAHLDRGTSRTSPRALPRQPRKRTHRSGGIVMAGAGQTPHAGTIANVDAEGIRATLGAGNAISTTPRPTAFRIMGPPDFDMARAGALLQSSAGVVNSLRRLG